MDSSEMLPVAATWFAVTWVTPRTVVLTEPHVDGLLQANLWYLRGRGHDLLVDSGNGIAPLAPVLARFARGGRREPTVLVTHAHIDHIGGFHEFQRRLLHPAEERAAAHIDDEVPLATATWPRELKGELAESGFTLPLLPCRARGSIPRPSASSPPLPRTSSEAATRSISAIAA
jgi:glyoxylase-like metal-dependent hydrolase (beta-lactamase superfamily II)